MSRSLKYDIPGDDPRISLDEIRESGWGAAFDASRGRAAGDAAPRASEGTARRRVLEIGFGRGEFLLDMAAKAPEVDFVGIEVSFKRTLKMARKVARARLPNVRLLEGAAEVVLREVFAPGSLAEIWVNFSDPWPKVRHGHRRVIQPRFVADVAEVLAEGGRLYIATDDVPYAHQMNHVLREQDALRNCYAPWPFLPEVEDRMQTGYEEQWRAEGRPMHFFAYASESVECTESTERTAQTEKAEGRA
ncbi:MAG: tRNA (guanosine(46)-N7)-methyltransferase TrmB [Myxococcota bacterium]